MDWKEWYSVNLPEIDSQHKALVDGVSRIEKAVEGKLHWVAVHSAIGQLLLLTRTHYVPGPLMAWQYASRHPLHDLSD